MEIALSSISTVLEITGQVYTLVQHCKEVNEKCKTAAQDVSDFQVWLKTLRNQLGTEALQREFSKRDSKNYDELRKAIDKCHSILREIEELIPVTPEKSSGGKKAFRKLRQHVSVSFNKSVFEAKWERLERIKGSIDTMLSSWSCVQITALHTKLDSGAEEIHIKLDSLLKEVGELKHNHHVVAKDRRVRQAGQLEVNLTSTAATTLSREVSPAERRSVASLMQDLDRIRGGHRLNGLPLPKNTPASDRARAPYLSDFLKPILYRVINGYLAPERPLHLPIVMPDSPLFLTLETLRIDLSNLDHLRFSCIYDNVDNRTKSEFHAERRLVLKYVNELDTALLVSLRSNRITGNEVDTWGHTPCTVILRILHEINFQHPNEFLNVAGLGFLHALELLKKRSPKSFDETWLRRLAILWEQCWRDHTCDHFNFTRQALVGMDRLFKITKGMMAFAALEYLDADALTPYKWRILLNRYPGFAEAFDQWDHIMTTIVRGNSIQILRDITASWRYTQSEQSHALFMALGWRKGLRHLVDLGMDAREACFGAIRFQDPKSLKIIAKTPTDLFSRPAELFEACIRKPSPNTFRILSAELARRRRELNDLALGVLQPEDCKKLGLGKMGEIPRDSHQVIVNLMDDYYGQSVPDRLQCADDFSTYAFILSTIHHLLRFGDAAVYLSILFGAGFKDMDVPNEEGETVLYQYCRELPLWKKWTFHSTPKGFRTQHSAHVPASTYYRVLLWFLLHCPQPKFKDELVRRDQTYPTPLFAMAYCAHHLAGSTSNWRADRLAARLRRNGLDATVTDDCDCLCSAAIVTRGNTPKGCMPHYLFLRPQGRLDKTFQRWSGTHFYRDVAWLNLLHLWPRACGLSGADKEWYYFRSCQLEVFERLEMAHTCCAGGGGPDAMTLRRVCPDDFERAEMQSEDRFNIMHITSILEEYRKARIMLPQHQVHSNKYRMWDRSSFWDIWWSGLDTILPPVLSAHDQTRLWATGVTMPYPKGRDWKGLDHDKWGTMLFMRNPRRRQESRQLFEEEVKHHFLAFHGVLARALVIQRRLRTTFTRGPRHRVQMTRKPRVRWAKDADCNNDVEVDYCEVEEPTYEESGSGEGLGYEEEDMIEEPVREESYPKKRPALIVKKPAGLLGLIKYFKQRGLAARTNNTAGPPRARRRGIQVRHEYNKLTLSATYSQWAAAFP